MEKPTKKKDSSAMKQILPVLLFFLIAGLGFEIIPLLVALALKLELFPKLFNTAEGLQALRIWVFGSGTWIWLSSVLGALGYFFTPPPQNRWLLLAPLYVPLLYGMGVLLYFGL